MTTELTKAAQQALEVLKTYRDAYNQAWVSGMDILEPDGDKAIDELESALTQRPAAHPTAQELESAAKVCDGFAAPDMAAALRGQRPAAQTERDTGPRVLREVFALCEDTMDKMAAESTEFSRGRAFEAKGISRAIGTWFQDEYCGRSHMGEPSLPAPQQATPEPVGEATEGEFFAFDPEGGHAFYKTRQEAIEHAKESLKHYLDGARAHGEWDEDVEQVRWGVVMQRAKATNIVTTEDGESACDYELQDVATLAAAQAKGGV